MLTEFRIRASVSTLQQTVTIGGAPRSVGITSTKLKKVIREGFTETVALPDQGAGLPAMDLMVYNMVKGDYQVCYSPQRQVNEFASERDMVVHCSLAIRARRPHYVSIPGGQRQDQWKHFVQTTEALNKLNNVVMQAGGTCFGDAELWCYMPIHYTDRERVKRLTRDNRYSGMASFFAGQDVPSTCFSSIGHYTFASSGISYLRSGGAFRVATLGSFPGNVLEQNGNATRLVLGQSRESDYDYYDTRQGRQNPGRIIPGPDTARLVALIQQEIESESSPNLWGEATAGVIPVMMEDDDDDFDDEPDYYEEDRF